MPLRPRPSARVATAHRVARREPRPAPLRRAAKPAANTAALVTKGITISPLPGEQVACPPGEDHAHMGDSLLEDRPGRPPSARLT